MAACGRAVHVGKAPPRCVLAAVLETSDDPATAGRLTEAAFRRDPNLRGLHHASVRASSVGASSVVRAPEGLGRLADRFVITHELAPNRHRLLRERCIDAVID